MILKKVRVKDYKCIKDSEEFNLNDVTCLVGKNESGKTALLEALHKLNPETEELGKFSDLDYPRFKWKPSMKEVDLPKNAISTEWELEESDIELINEKLGVEVLNSHTVKIKKGYDNVGRWTIDFNEKKLARHIIKESNLSAPELNQIKDEETVEDIINSLKGINEKSGKQQQLLEELNNTYSRGKTSLAIIDLLNKQLPKFLYFSDYYKLPGEIALNGFKKRKNNGQLKIGDRVFSALLSLVGTSAEELDGIKTFRRLHASLEAVSNRLTSEIFEYWSQNKHLEVKFSFDQALPNDPPPLNEGFIFRTSIRNQRHKSTVNFNERSSGFVWFFSFLVWFSQVRENYGDNLIILLDEPALNLHARAQNDLIRYINEELKPSFQVLYTTHSPFMVDPDNLLGTRTVEDVIVQVNENGRQKEKLLGTKVSEDILTVEPDTLSPLQGALGYDITQSLFVGKYTLLVEGPSDLMYINWINEELRRRGKETLDERWTICPVGGVDKVSSFAALFSGNKLNISVLLDYHKGVKGKIRNLKESKILKSGRVFTPEMYLELEEGDIEDLLGPENYTVLVNKCYNLDDENKFDEFNSEERIVKQVEDHMRTVTQEGVSTFNHFTPSSYLLENSSELIDSLPKLDEALARFETLFIDLNQVFFES